MKAHFLAAALCCLLLFAKPAKAVTLVAGQTDYTTTSNITVSSVAGISSNLSGTLTSLNKITNTYTITTSGSGVYGIRSTGTYNQITNSVGAFINTNDSSGRGISVANYSVVNNSGAISTLGTTAHGIYAGGNYNSISNSGAINTVNSSAYAIYLNGDNNLANSLGSINARVYGIYATGNVNQIINSGNITTTVSSSAHGIFVSAGSASTANASSYSTISNSGVINSSGHGIYVKDNFSLIQNSGTISASLANSIYGIRSEGANSVINNSGAITALKYAIYSSGADSVINNFLSLNGGVYFVQSNTLNIFGGAINGALDSDGTGNVNIGSLVYSNVVFNQTASFTGINDLVIAGSSVLNSAATIGANRVLINDSSIFNLNEGANVSGLIGGFADGVGVVNIFNSSFSAANSIGFSGNSLASLNVATGANLNMAHNIYANDVVVGGVLNFSGADNLQILGSVAVNGFATLNIGNKNQTISGDFTLNDQAILNVALKNSGAGFLNVLGSVDIADGAKLKISTAADQGYITNGSNYVILSGSGSINAISSNNILVNDVNSNIYGLLKFSTSAVGDSLILHIDRLLPDEVTSNKNAQNIYQSLINIGASASGKMLEFQQYLDNSGLRGDALAEVLNQLAPQSAKAQVMSINNVMSNSIEISEKRFEEAKFDNQLWVRFFGSSIEQNAIADDEGYGSNSSAIIFGLEKEIGDRSIVGSSISLARASIKNNDGNKNNAINIYQINLFGRHNFDDFFVDSAGALALNQFNANRQIAALQSSAKADYWGASYAFKIKSGLVEKAKYGFNLIPEVTLNFLHNNIFGYSETGVDSLNLKVSEVSANFLEGRTGVNFKYNFKKRAKKFEFQKFSAAAKISYARAFINSISDLKATFANYSQNSFNNKVSNLDNDSIRLGFELSAFHKDNTIFTLDYNFDYRATSIIHQVMAIIKSEF